MSNLFMQPYLAGEPEGEPYTDEHGSEVEAHWKNRFIDPRPVAMHINRRDFETAISAGWATLVIFASPRTMQEIIYTHDPDVTFGMVSRALGVPPRSEQLDSWGIISVL